MSAYTLKSEIKYLKGVGPARANLLQEELSVQTFEDLLLHFPFRHYDRSKIYNVAALRSGMSQIQMVLTIKKVQLIPMNKGKRLMVLASDDTGNIELVFFKGIKYFSQVLKPGQKYLVFGKPGFFNRNLNIVHPEVEVYNPDKVKKLKRLQPVYSVTEKMKKKSFDSRGLARIQENLIPLVEDQITENLPAELLRKFSFPGRKTAIKWMHFPPGQKELIAASNRLKFEELFFLQLELLHQNKERKKKLKGYVFEQVGDFFKTFYADHIPFELTGAQKRVLREIRLDLKTGFQMNRLVQGDVGSGKTLVALMSMLLAIDNGLQSCLLAPTEILAQQHFNTLNQMLEEMNLNIRLLTGSTKQAARKEILNGLESGSVHIIVGTHALLENKVKFNRLGFAVIDEQHRFGVAQRAKLWAKGKIAPHILVMTATPIPRTLAMTLYGDLDTSVIDELPPGRKPVVTKHAFERDRLKVFKFIRDIVEKGQQVYVVYPLIEESEAMDYNNLMEGFKAITREFPQPKYQLSIVHGKMKPDDKEFEMQRFKKGETQIMVATTVIEVGVDVPNASLMVIESAERFGLSQLHQLRGRVGRGAEHAYCILITGEKLSNDARKRMETMVRSSNGFELSEVDLQLRGPGDLMGTQQSGVLDLKIADLAKDQKILTAARYAAREVLESDPTLREPGHKMISSFIKNRRANKFDWGLIS